MPDQQTTQSTQITPTFNEIPVPVVEEPVRIERLMGFLPTTTTTPAWSPTKFMDGFALDTSSAIFYYYDYTNKAWKTISTVPVVPVGTILMYGSATPPSGYLMCDGNAVSRTTYAALFAVIGTTFGAPDSSNFNVPYMQGRVPIGGNMGSIGDGGGAAGAAGTRPTGGSNLTTFAIGAWKGEETHTLSEAEIPSHTHTPQAYSSGIGSTLATTAAGNATPGSLAPATTATGGGGAHNNIQPVLALGFIIKT